MRLATYLSPGGDLAAGVELAKRAEALGYDGLWYPDHFMPNAAQPTDGFTPEALAVLAGLAATVPRVRLGALVAGNTYRHPAVLANAVATIDEGIAVVTHAPELLEQNRCFMLSGSRRPDRRVPAMWISERAPKLGWCWDGNPHSWLGVASATRRVA